MAIGKPEETPTTIDEIRGDSGNTFAQLNGMFEALREGKTETKLYPASKKMVEEIKGHTRDIV
ncbi:hypothetical protein EOM39_03780 [Candidatus Gracilibacteria bacterium]|nr:hypothetical protein [Candidatus Gracilibacteria bacterium]